MIALDDAELDSIMAAAQPLPPRARREFLAALAAEVAKHPEVGPGLIFRLIRETQRQFFDPPDLSPGKYE